MLVVRKLSLLLLGLLLFAVQELSAQYDKDVFSYRGRLSLSDGKYAQAIENFNILARLDTTDHWTFFFRGIAKYNLGDIRGAQRDFNTSVRLNPVFTSGYHYRAITFNRFARYDEALADLERAITLRPGQSGLYFTRGVTYFLSGQFDKAISDFDKYIRREPKDPSAFLNRGASYLFSGDTLKAVNDYNKAIKLDRFDPEGFVRRGRLYAASKDYDKAISDMNHAIDLDSTNTFAYFNRAIMQYEQKNYKDAMADLNRVLKDEPGNALTLYNRGLIHAQLGAYEEALADLDRVLNINPQNVLAYFNRASVFISMHRWQDALEDYDKAIELYPDFAKAYMNRSYVKSMLGDAKASKKDYDIARKKIAEYQASTANNKGSFADTTKKYSSLLALDAEFAKKDFDDELLQHRDVDIRLRPLYAFRIVRQKDDGKYALVNKYDNPLIKKFESRTPVPVAIGPYNQPSDIPDGMDELLYQGQEDDVVYFLRALKEYSDKHFTSALNYYGKAIEQADTVGVEALYRAFYYMNRGVLRAEMIDFISSIENNVNVLAMDDKGAVRARVKDRVTRQYDYTDALNDMEAAVKLLPDVPYIRFNFANLLCMASEHIRSIDQYSKAIELYPYMGDAYFNRGLVLIYLKDKEKGCIDLSRAGELGIRDAYSVIKKYCEEDK